MRGHLKVAWAKRLTEANLDFRADWVVPSGPFKAEAFQNFQGERGFANAGESCKREYKCSHHACARDIKVGCSLTCAIKQLLCSLKERGESLSLFRFLLVLIHMLLVSQSWYSTLELIFSSMFVKQGTEKAKQGLHPQHL